MISFKGKQYTKAIIMMAMRWYFAYALSYRDVEELLKERGIPADHSAVKRWIEEYGPKLDAIFKRRKRFTNGSWRMDETYVKVKGQWYYQYRAADKHGHTIECMLSKKRDKAAAKRFFKKAIRTAGLPEKITIDKSGSNTAGIKVVNAELSEQDQIEIRRIKYLNNIVEQDHRFIKKIVKPMKGFKCFRSASATLKGIELHHMLRKRQHINSNDLTVWEQFFSLADAA